MDGSTCAKGRQATRGKPLWAPAARGVPRARPSSGHLPPTGRATGPHREGEVGAGALHQAAGAPGRAAARRSAELRHVDGHSAAFGGEMRANAGRGEIQRAGDVDPGGNTLARSGHKVLEGQVVAGRIPCQT